MVWPLITSLHILWLYHLVICCTARLMAFELVDSFVQIPGWLESSCECLRHILHPMMLRLLGRNCLLSLPFTLIASRNQTSARQHFQSDRGEKEADQNLDLVFQSGQDCRAFKVLEMVVFTRSQIQTQKPCRLCNFLEQEIQALECDPTSKHPHKRLTACISFAE